MQLLNKLKLLTDKERELIIASKNERTKSRFNNPTAMRKRIKEKSNHLFLAIPKLVDDVVHLYNFNIEENLRYADIPNNASDIPGNVLVLMLFAGPLAGYQQNELSDDLQRCAGKFVEFLKSTDAKTMLLLTVSSLYLNSPEEYKRITEPIYKNLRENYNNRMSIPEPRQQSHKDKRIEEFVNSLEDSGVDVKKFFQEFFRSTLASRHYGAHLKILQKIKSPNERAVAFAVLTSKNGMLERNDIVKKTGLDKRFVTRYAEKLVNKGILKKLNKYYLWNDSIIQQLTFSQPAP